MRIRKKSLDETHPEIALEWDNHLNKDIYPKNITAGSNKKFWFKCKNGHKFKTSPKTRTRSTSTGCPYCAGKKVSYENCLQTKFPKIAQEWHKTKNGNLTPKDVTPFTNRKVWWQCQNSHEWQSQISNRTAHGSDCPYCSGNKVCYENCLQTQFSKIAQEWHKTKNGNLTPKDVVAGSNKKVWWRCQNSHEWQSQISSRTGNGRGCPYCSGNKVCYENCLQTKFPKIAQEWHQAKNEKITPKDVVAGSKKKFWFKCKNDHTWKTSLSVRTVDGCGCPYCSSGTTEEEVREFFEKHLGVPFHKSRPKFLGGQEFDGANENLKLAFEYDGEFHYVAHYRIKGDKNRKKHLQYTKKLDRRKNELCKKNGWKLIRINYTDKKNLEQVIIRELIKAGFKVKK